MHAAKTHLSRLLSAVENGERVIIERRNVGGSVTRFALVPADTPDRAALFGALRGEFRMPTDDEWADGDREIAAMFAESATDPLDPAR